MTQTSLEDYGVEVQEQHPDLEYPPGASCVAPGLLEPPF